jgi:hypothetical protein
MSTRQVTRGHLCRAAQVLLIWATSCIPPTACQASAFAGGTGGPDDPYQIATAGQLVSIGSDLNLLSKHFVLVNDIDLDPNLVGVFADAVIAPYVCRSPRGPDVGTKGLVRDLGVEAGDVRCGTVNDQPPCPGCPASPPASGCPCSQGVDDYTSMGILVGYNQGTVTACYAKGYVCAQGHLGGLAGRNEGAVVGCYSEAM